LAKSKGERKIAEAKAKKRDVKIQKAKMAKKKHWEEKTHKRVKMGVKKGLDLAKRNWQYAKLKKLVRLNKGKYHKKHKKHQKQKKHQKEL
jgi:hypothetical protein